MKLVIIGNGFDQHFRLPTGVEDFTKLIDDYDIRNLYGCSGIYWNEYEESLSEIELESMADSFVERPDYLSDRESDRDSGIWAAEENMSEMMSIRDDALKKMVEEANTCTEELNIRKRFNSDSLILTFNYTSTIEILFCFDTIVNIFHIHGFFEENGELVFGYSKSNYDIVSDFSSHDVITGNYFIDKEHDRIIMEAEEYGGYDGSDYYIHEQYQRFFDFYMQNKKELRVKQLIDYILPSSKNIDEVVVLGHSMGEVDAPYFEIIEDIVKPTVWRISQYNGNPDIYDVQNYTFKNKILYFNDINSFMSDV